MASVPQKIPSAPHSFVDGVEGKVCGEGRRQKRKASIDCGQWHPITEYQINNVYEDGRALTCIHCIMKQKEAARGTARETALVPVTQYPDVPIHTGTGRGVQFERNGPLYVSIADITEFFGVDAQGQLRKLQDDPNFALGLKRGRDISTPGGLQEMWFIRADLVSGWLYLINPNKVRQDRRAGLMAYRDACTKVLNDYITGSVTAPPSPAQTQQIDLWQPTEQNVRHVVRTEAKAAVLEALHEEQIKAITIEKTNYIERPVDGRVYIAEASPKIVKLSSNHEVIYRHAQGWRYLYISETGRGEDERLAEYRKKTPEGVPPPEKRKVIASDRRKKLEKALHTHLPAGVWRIPGKRDEFMVSPDAFALLMELPDYIPATQMYRIQHWMLSTPIVEEVTA